MNKLHKVRTVLPRWAVNQHGRAASYRACSCEYGQDHDDFRSISTQDKEVCNGTNDMLRVARREKWNFTPKELEHTISWLNSAGPWDGKELTPVPFAEEIIALIKGGTKPDLKGREET